ncbi:MAG: rhomboid family intramembrane serine protease [Myxococcales bacterium]
MDLNQIALWLAGLPAATLFWKSARAPHRPIGWLVVSGVVLLVALLGWFVVPEYAGYAAGTLALLFILLPTWIHNAAARASNRFLYRRARRLFTYAALLHPFDGWLDMPRLFQAFELAHLGKTAEAEALLLVLSRGTGNTAAIAQAHRLRILGRWRELKALAEANGLMAVGRDPSLLVLYLRALGELGEVDHLAEFMRAREETLLGTGAFEAGLLYLFAFSGQVELTRQALAAGRETYTDDARQFWVALASQRAGDVAQAQRLFGALRQSSDLQIRQRAERHIDELLYGSPAEPPSMRVLQIVAHFARLAGQRRHLLPNPQAQRAARRMTISLVVANTVVFLIGSHDSRPRFDDTTEAFVKLWAFEKSEVLAGQWWRLFSYMFVHGNLVHLVMNMAGLWVLGPLVERTFGRLRFALIYLASGVAACSLYLFLPANSLVGASGCIMGLLGATIAVALRAWVTQRAPIARQFFVRLLSVVALQVVFDQSINYMNRGDKAAPQIAGLAHYLGLTGGFLAALLLREAEKAKTSLAGSV